MGAPSTKQLLEALAAAEPKPAAAMSEEEREAALLPHLCAMQRIPPQEGQSTAYVQTPLTHHIWQVM